jgi:uncharacterized protein (TIGR02145 family)
MKIGEVNIPIKRPCQGYYLRWYYNGWHYWFFLPGEIVMNTEGENYDTIGSRKISMGSGQVTYEQINALRTIRNSREIHMLTADGWMNVRIEPGSVTVKNNYINGYEFEFVAMLGSREGYYSPVAEVPTTTVNQHAIVITHHNVGVFTMTISGIPGSTIIIDWGDGTPPETIVLTGGDDVITHDYTGTTGEHEIVIEGEENIITLEADGQHITEITIPPTAINLEELILPNNEITDSPEIPDTVPLVILDLTGNPLTTCEVVIGTQIWMCKNYASSYPGSKVYDNEANRAIYGGLYTYNQVIASGFCPSGWHVPTKDEWQALIDYIGGDSVAGEKLKEDGTVHWDFDAANNVTGFTALGGGEYFGYPCAPPAPEDWWQLGLFLYQKYYGKFWTSSESEYYESFCIGSEAYYVRLGSHWTNAEMLSADKSMYHSVRLLKNVSAPPVQHIFDDWFLPSKDELRAMYDELYLFGVGGFTGAVYKSSTEDSYFGSPDTQADGINFPAGFFGPYAKSLSQYVRACRAFTTTTVYSLRGIGPAGGLIFYINGDDYLEAAPVDCANSVWSNINNVAIGTTGTAIGTGQANTTAIIGQVGHTTSAAKLCDDLVITYP